MSEVDDNDSFYDFRTGYACRFQGADQAAVGSVGPEYVGETKAAFIFKTAIVCDFEGDQICSHFLRDSGTWEYVDKDDTFDQYVMPN